MAIGEFWGALKALGVSPEELSWPWERVPENTCGLGRESWGALMALGVSPKEHSWPWERVLGSTCGIGRES